MDLLIKPDVMLVTKNVMVPHALPPSKNKIFLNSISSKTKTKIVRAKKYKLPKLGDLDYSDKNKKTYSEQKLYRNFHNSGNTSSIDFCKEDYDEILKTRVSDASHSRLDEYVDKKSKNCKQGLLSGSFPPYLEKKIESGRVSMQRSSKSLQSDANSNSIKIRMSKKLVYKKAAEVKSSQHENEDPDILNYKIKRKIKKIVLLDSSQSLISNLEDNNVNVEKEESKTFIANISEDNKFKEDPKDPEIFSLDDENIKNNKSKPILVKFMENQTEDVIEIKTKCNNIASQLSTQSIVELDRCISDDQISKVQPSMEQPEPVAGKKCDVRYSWQDLDNWIPPSEKRNLSRIKKYDDDCKVKYSWQIIGTETQTSYDLIESLLYDDSSIGQNSTKNYPCVVKYSWQIIGTATQVSFPNNSRQTLENNKEYWEGKIMTPSRVPFTAQNIQNKKRRILYSESTQTCAQKFIQTNDTQCQTKYSWQNLTRRYLENKRYT